MAFQTLKFISKYSVANHFEVAWLEIKVIIVLNSSASLLIPLVLEPHVDHLVRGMVRLLSGRIAQQPLYRVAR